MSYSELSAYYQDFSTGYWRDPDPKVCPCRGGGWALSQVDTWHQCPCHFKGQPHPESDEEEYDAWEEGEETPEASYFVDEQNLVQLGEPRTHWWEEPLTSDDDIPF